MALGRRQWISLSLGGMAACTRPLAALEPRLQWRERALLGFGTTLWLRAGHADGSRVGAGLDAAVSAIRHVEQQMSLFNPSSALCRLNADGVLHKPHPHLVTVLNVARDVSERSHGAFDVSIQPLWKLWAQAARQGHAPTAAELAVARRLADWRAIAVNEASIKLGRPGMALTLNGIAQGFAADLAKAALQREGIAHALLNTGEWAPMGRSPEALPWTLGIENPRSAENLVAKLQADGRAVATSSDAHMSFSADHSHHHILDPRTGSSPPEMASVTVLAESGALADALTKVFFMTPWNQTLAMARRWKVDVLVVDKGGRWQASSAVPLS